MSQLMSENSKLQCVKPDLLAYMATACGASSKHLSAGHERPEACPHADKPTIEGKVLQLSAGDRQFPLNG